MTTRIATSQVRHAQQIEVAASGPDGVNTLIINTGALDINTFLNNPGDQMTTVKETYAVLLPLSLQSGQFRQAIATACDMNLVYRKYES